MSGRIASNSLFFLQNLQKLPKSAQSAILKKAQELEKAPEDNGNSQVKLHGQEKIPPPPGLPPYRAKVANHYRLLYAFDNKNVYLISAWKKKETGDDYTKVVKKSGPIAKPAAQIPETLIKQLQDIPEEEVVDEAENHSGGSVDADSAPILSPVLLQLAKIDRKFWKALTQITHVEQLYDLEKRGLISDDQVLRIVEILESEPDPSTAFKFVETDNPWELMEKIIDGKLSTESLVFKLTEEQKDLVHFSFEQNGAVLIKGASGTGKSLVAHHRVKSYLDYLRGQLDYVNKSPAILYTTYTNALLTESRKNLENIIGKKDLKDCVEIRTVHSVLKETYIDCQKELKKINFFQRVSGKISEFRNIDPVCRNPRDTELLPELIDKSENEPKEFFKRIGVDYLADEIEYLIYGHKLNTREKYLNFNRKGRKLPLQAKHRNFIYDIKESLEKTLSNKMRLTWKQLAPVTIFLRNSIRTEKPNSFKNLKMYDAIVVDEGQDLTPMELKFLSELVPSQNRIFVVADSTQAIHQPGNVSLQDEFGIDFQGRIRELKVNYRSTKQIAAAAGFYLNQFDLKNETETDDFFYSGPKPRLWNILGKDDDQFREEINSVATELKILKLQGKSNLANIAIFTISGSQCKEINEILNSQGIPSRFCDSKTYEKSRKNEITVMPLKSVKGLEFPSVYIVGLGNNFPKLGLTESDDVFNEKTIGCVRDLFVGMTRAMYSLTLCIGSSHNRALFSEDHFSDEFWEKN